MGVLSAMAWLDDACMIVCMDVLPMCNDLVVPRMCTVMPGLALPALVLPPSA